MTRCQRPASEAGTSLIETLIATALMGFIAVGIFPLFHRALANNISGSDSNQASQHGKSELEGLLALPFDSQVFDMNTPLIEHVVESEGPADKMTLSELYWDSEAYTRDAVSGETTRHLSSGAWIQDQDAARGLVIWRRRSVVRQYSRTDIADGVIDVQNPDQIVTQGHPQLFDSPLKRDAPESLVNFKEEDVTLESLRPGVPELRMRLMRTY